jgi:hypothetical protein
MRKTHLSQTYCFLCVTFLSGCGLATNKGLKLEETLVVDARDNAFDANVSSKFQPSTCDGKSAGSIEQRLRFERSSVSFGEACATETQTRVCNAGKWSDWTGSYSSENCVVQRSLDCVGGINGSQESRIRYKALSVSFGENCQQEIQTRSCNSGVWSPWSGTYDEGVCAIGEPKQCDGRGHGSTDTRIRYKTAEASFGSTCQGELQVRFCDNGNFTDWSGTYSNESCKVQQPAACTNPTIAHGGIATRIKYKEETPQFGNQCASEVQVASCFNGKSTGFSGSFSFDNCNVQAPKKCQYAVDTSSPLKTLNHGDPIAKTVYETAEVEFGSQCQFENLVGICNNGQLSFAPSKFSSPKSTCVVKKAAACEGPNGSLTASGTVESVTKYISASAKFGESCQPEVRNRACNNGTWSPWSGSATFDSCSVEKPASCGLVAHGELERQVRYEKSAVAYGKACTAEVQLRTCNNGIFSPWSGKFTEPNCSILPALGCGLIAHDGVETRVMYASSSVPFGGNCQSEVQARTCANGTLSNWSGTLTFEKCSVQEAAACKGDVASGTTESRKMFLSTNVAFGQNCQQETQVRTCTNGLFSNWSGSFTASACNVEQPVSCGSTPHGGFETRTRFAESISNTSGQCISEIQSRACSNGTFGAWSGQYPHEKCEKRVPQMKAFEYSGKVETFTVPQGVTQIEIKAWGAGGCVFDETPNYSASHTADYGGAGGFSSAVVSVQPGEVISVQVGQGGQKTSSNAGGYPNGGAGFNGGCDGGGSSNIYSGTTQQNLILVAGGGGGAGWYTPGGAKRQGNGAAGGGLIARSGENNPGAGGTQSEGGQVGNNKGSAMRGGASSGNGGSGGPGAGGGGYFGGASGVGGNGGTNGGGGGGSCYIGLANDGSVLGGNAGSSGVHDYTDPAGVYRLTGGRSYSLARCLSGSGKNPPNQSDIDYVAGIGMGGDKINAVQIPGYSANWKTAVGGHGRVVVRYAIPESSVTAPATQTTSTIVATKCASDEAYLTGIGCLYKESNRYLIGIIKQNVLNPTQVSGVVRPDDVSKVIDDARWLKIWNASDATTAGNWRLVAQMETSANSWESVSEPPANNIHLMKNANRLPLLKTLAAPVLTAYVYSIFHHETSGDSWTGSDYSGIIYGGTNGYSTFGWYNQAGNPSFFGTAYSYASLRMKLWLYPSSVDLAGLSTPPP